MKKLFNKKSILGCFGIFAFIFACGIFAQTFAQDQYVVQQAQDAVRNKIIKKEGGNVTFSVYERAETYNVSRNKTGVRGYGTWSRNYNSGEQDFSYEARVDTRKNKVSKIKYKFLSDNDDGNGKVPRWAIGTFNGKNPQTGGNISLSVNESGSVVVRFANGTTSYASMDGRRLTNNGAVANVTRINNGIRTTRTDTGEQIDYFRTGSNGNGNGNYDRDGDVPSWAVGTFYARNPQNGETITLNIPTTGRVIINFGNSVSYATVRGNILTNDGIESRITRIRNGIRTTRIDNGERIDYYTSNTNNGGYNNRNDEIPSWAIGTFYGKNPRNGENITMTIRSDGDVTINFGNSVDYATLSGNSLYYDGAESRVTKTRRGIRTTQIDTGERIDYRRQ